MKNIKIYFIAFIIFLVDLISKICITMHLDLGKSISVIDGFFSLTYVKNTGGAFSILTDNTLLLAVVGIAILLYIIYYIFRNTLSRLEFISISFILGGLLGNLFDRIFRDGVIDFLDFNILGYDFPIFNISDIFIVCGIILMIFIELGGNRYASRRK